MCIVFTFCLRSYASRERGILIIFKLTKPNLLKQVESKGEYDEVHGELKSAVKKLYFHLQFDFKKQFPLALDLLVLTFKHIFATNITAQREVNPVVFVCLI